MTKATPQELEALAAPIKFDRYVRGLLMAEGVCIERQTTLAGAMQEAARLAEKGPNGEVPVLVYRPSASDALREALAECQRWHEREDKALSKSGRGDADYYWRRGEHKREIERISVVLARDPCGEIKSSDGGVEGHAFQREGTQKPFLPDDHEGAGLCEVGIKPGPSDPQPITCEEMDAIEQAAIAGKPLTWPSLSDRRTGSAFEASACHSGIGASPMTAPSIRETLKSARPYIENAPGSNAALVLAKIDAALSAPPQDAVERIARTVTSELEKMHKEGVPMCMREGETTWRTYHAGFDLSMFAQRISAAILASGLVTVAGENAVTLHQLRSNQFSHPHSDEASIRAALDQAIRSLDEIAAGHIPDCPLHYAGDELAWAQRHVGHLRRKAEIARDAIAAAIRAGRDEG